MSSRHFIKLCIITVGPFSSKVYMGIRGGRSGVMPTSIVSAYMVM